jgi:hypothetical protein
MHNGEHFEQNPRLQPANCACPPDLAALATDNPPLPGASELAAVSTYCVERAQQNFNDVMGGASMAEQAAQSDIVHAEYALRRCRNPADRWNELPVENALVGANVSVLQQDPWLAEAAQHQQQQQERPPPVVHGVWPELSMMPHSCAPNTSAAVMHKVRGF